MGLKMKKQYIILSFAAFLCLFLASCSKEENTGNIAQPTEITIDDLEIGADDSRKVYTDSDLHLEANIIADAGIKQVQVQIFPQTDGISFFTISKIYSEEIGGGKQFLLHEHYDVPKLSREGKYDVFIVVTDLNGQRKVFEYELLVEKDPLSAVFTNLNITANNTRYTMTVRGFLKLPAGATLKKITIEALHIKQVYEGADIEGKTTYVLDKTLDISALSLPWHFDAILTLTDQNGKEYKTKRNIHQH